MIFAQETYVSDPFVYEPLRLVSRETEVQELHVDDAFPPVLFPLSICTPVFGLPNIAFGTEWAKFIVDTYLVDPVFNKGIGRHDLANNLDLSHVVNFLWDAMRQTPPPVVAYVPKPTTETPEAVQLTRCLEDLQQWLGRGLSQISEASGISRSTVYAWKQRGSDPRPSTISAILSFHSLVKFAIAKMGESEARVYFITGDPSPLDQMERAADPAEYAQVINMVRRSLAVSEVPPPDRLLAITPEDSRRASHDQ